MAKPKKRTTRKYTKHDDAKNCTFKPKIRKYRSETKTDPDEDQDFHTRMNRFIDRQEASKSTLDRSLKLKRGEKAYKMQLRKRTCRDCGATQSYDEVEKKKKRCPCGGKYAFASTAGSHISDEKRHEMFIERLKMREKQKYEKMKRLKAKVELEERGGCSSTRRRRPGTPRRFEETGFLRRMKDDMKKREKRRQEARGLDETKHQTLTNALRSVKSDLRRCEGRIQAAASKSASRKKYSRSRVYGGGGDNDEGDDSSRRIQKLQEQLQAASLMAQELQNEITSPTRRGNRNRPPLHRRSKRSGGGGRSSSGRRTGSARSTSNSNSRRSSGGRRGYRGGK